MDGIPGMTDLVTWVLAGPLVGLAVWCWATDPRYGYTAWRRHAATRRRRTADRRFARAHPARGPRCLP